MLLGAPPVRAENLFEGVGRLFEDWGLFQGIRVSGSNTFTLQEHALDGSESAFQGQRWDTDTLVRRSSLHVEGPIWKNLGIQADISSTGWGDSYTRYVMGWTTDETALYYGDLNIRLGGNEFASFNKTLQGWQIDQEIPGGLLRGFYSKEKGLTRRETITGNNTSGPFFLRYTPIIEGSEVVKVDEQVMRFGEDYRLDYETGQLRFEPVDAPPRVIPSTSTISVSYQSFGYESSPGALYGARAEVQLLDNDMLLGLTGLMQDKKQGNNASDTAGFQEDIYQASGTTGPFDTNFRPLLPNGSTVVIDGERQTIDQTVVVLVDNVEQVQGVDYDVYHEIGRIIFRRAVPPTALVIIRYYYDLGEQQFAGDSQIFGVDLGYRITDDLTFRTDWAQSDQGSARGQAWRSNLAYSRPDLTATLEMRDVQPDFSYVDTVGFQRKERGLNFAAQWQANEHISVYERFSDLKSDSGLSFGSFRGGGGTFTPLGMDTAQAATPTTLENQTQRNDFGIDVNYPGWPTLSLTRQTLENRGGTNSGRQQTSDMLSLNYAPYDLPFTVNFNLSSADIDYDEDPEATSTLRGSSTEQMQLSATYTPSSTLSLSGHYGTNRSNTRGSDDRSDGVVTQLSARWNPSNDLSFSLDHTRSESTGSTSRFSTFQIDNPGGGGGGIGDDDDDTDEQTRYEDANTRMDVSWRPADDLNFTLSAGFRDYTSGGGIGYLADSEQTYYNASLGWRPTDELALTTTWGRDDQVFLEEGAGAVKNDMLALGVNYRPNGEPWAVSMNLHKQTGSSPTTISSGGDRVTRIVPTDLFDISGELSYELRPGMTLFGRMGRADYDSGYAAFVKDTSELGLRYRVSDLADVSVGYRFIKNLSGDPALPLPGAQTGAIAGQDYIAQTFMVEISSNFASGLGSSGRTSTERSGFSGALSSFGGYGAGRTVGYGYEAGGIGDFSSGRSYDRNQLGRSGRSTSPFGGPGGGFSGRSTDFFAGPDDTRGSSAQYEGTTGARDGFETGLGDFEEQEDPTVQQRDTQFGENGQIGPRPPFSDATDDRQPDDWRGRCLQEGVDRWWQWYD